MLKPLNNYCWLCVFSSVLPNLDEKSPPLWRWQVQIQLQFIFLSSQQRLEINFMKMPWIFQVVQTLTFDSVFVMLILPYYTYFTRVAVATSKLHLSTTVPLHIIIDDLLKPYNPPCKLCSDNLNLLMSLNLIVLGVIGLFLMPHRVYGINCHHMSNYRFLSSNLRKT